jgi:hypothetical protein
MRFRRRAPAASAQLPPRRALLNMRRTLLQLRHVARR